MAFSGLTITIKRDENMQAVIKNFWEEVINYYSINSLQGLVHGVTCSEIQYTIGFYENSMTKEEADSIKLSDSFKDAKYKIVWVPNRGWVSYHGKLDNINLCIENIKNDSFTYQLHRFTRGKRGRKYVIMVNKRNLFN